MDKIKKWGTFLVTASMLSTTQMAGQTLDKTSTPPINLSNGKIQSELDTTRLATLRRDSIEAAKKAEKNWVTEFVNYLNSHEWIAPTTLIFAPIIGAFGGYLTVKLKENRNKRKSNSN